MVDFEDTMIYKEDWDRARERFRAWLSGEIIDRVVIQVTAPRKGVKPTSSWSGWDLVHNLDNPERAFREFEKRCKETYFGGEAFPNLCVNLGPGIAAAYLGCPPRIEEDTVWFEAPETKPWDEILSLRLDPGNRWWKITKDITSQAVEYGRGKFFVGITDLNAVLNILGSLRGTQRLLMDLIDHPREVKEACSLITEIWFSCYDELLKITQRYMSGASTWMGIWFPGRGSDVQCDFSAMISPKMFEEFVIPHLQEQCRRLEYSIYHWDGPGQIPHLDLLLDIPELDGIQWTPGAGNPGTGSPRWFGLYRRIQERGKLLVLLGVAKEDIEGVLKELSPKGILISTNCDSEDEARDLLRKAERWTADR